MSIDLAIWKWDDEQDLPDVSPLHAQLDKGEPHPAMLPFDTAAFEEALRDLYGRMPEGGWTYEVKAPEGGAPWVRFQVDIGLIQLLAPRLVDVAVVHGLVVSDPHNDHVIGA